MQSPRVIKRTVASILALLAIELLFLKSISGTVLRDFGVMDYINLTGAAVTAVFIVRSFIQPYVVFDAGSVIINYHFLRKVVPVRDIERVDDTVLILKNGDEIHLDSWSLGNAGIIRLRQYFEDSH